MVKKITKEAYDWVFNSKSRASNSDYLDILVDLEEEIEHFSALANNISREFHFGNDVDENEIEDAVRFFKNINKQVKDYYNKNNLSRHNGYENS